MRAKKTLNNSGALYFRFNKVHYNRKMIGHYCYRRRRRNIFVDFRNTPDEALENPWPVEHLLIMLCTLTAHIFFE